MILGPISAFTIPGYATRALTRSEQGKLIERFMHADFGVATLGEVAANAEALKRGGEIVGRYLFKAHEWVVWGRVAAPDAEPDHTPGLILHATEYRDGWHRGEEHMVAGPDHPTEQLHDEIGGPKVTIMAPQAPEVHIEVQRHKTDIVLRAAGHEFAWPIAAVPAIAAGLRACADGDPAPAGCNGMVFARGDRVAVTCQPATAPLGFLAGVGLTVVVVQGGLSGTEPWTYIMRKVDARGMADAIEAEAKEEPLRYWIAINGSSCALFPIPLRNPVTTPTAQQLFGFPTLKEAQKAQHICLNAPIPEAKAFFDSLRPDVISGRIAHLTPANPDPQTRGQTVWMEGTPTLLPGLPGGPSWH